MMIYTQTSFKHKKKKTKSKRKLAETAAYWEWRKKHGTHPSQMRKKKKDSKAGGGKINNKFFTGGMVNPSYGTEFDDR